MWIPALLLWILNIANLCSGQDFTDYYQTGGMGTQVRLLISHHLKELPGLIKKKKLQNLIEWKRIMNVLHHQNSQ